MAETEFHFTDGAAYERFMGPWTRAIGSVFLGWLSLPAGQRWLDVGCGTGIFTQLVLDACSPAIVVAVDPSAAQIDYARKQPAAQWADFRVASAHILPFPDCSFDVVGSALVINFISDRPRALAEMRRVARPSGTVAGYVWDFAGGGGSAWPLARGMRQIGIEPPRVPGTEDSSVEALKSLFKQAGFEEIAVRSIDITVAFPGFDDFWRSQTWPCTPSGKVIAMLPETHRAKLAETIRSALPVGSDGRIVYSARANAVKARVPG